MWTRIVYLGGRIGLRQWQLQWAGIQVGHIIRHILIFTFILIIINISIIINPAFPRTEYVRWEREHDAYYPRDTYRSQYCHHYHCDIIIVTNAVIVIAPFIVD